MLFAPENGGITLESNLTKRLRKRHFLCGIELLTYYRTIGKYTTLYLEGEREKKNGELNYSFYKMRCLPSGKSYFKVYCSQVPIQVALKRIESFSLYFELHKDNRGRWFA